MSSQVPIRVGAAIPSATVPDRVTQFRRRYLGAFLVASLLLVLWQSLRIILQLPAYKLPDPLSIVGEFAATRPSGELVAVSLGRDLLVTWWEAALGFAFGATAGVAMAIVFTRSRVLQRGLLPYVVMSQTIPILAIAPIVLFVMFGQYIVASGLIPVFAFLWATLIMGCWLVFFYTLVVKGLILDRWPGWYYVFQRTLAEILLSLRLIETRFKTRNRAQ